MRQSRLGVPDELLSPDRRTDQCLYRNSSLQYKWEISFPGGIIPGERLEMNSISGLCVFILS